MVFKIIPGPNPGLPKRGMRARRAAVRRDYTMIYAYLRGGSRCATGMVEVQGAKCQVAGPRVHGYGLK